MQNSKCKVQNYWRNLNVCHSEGREEFFLLVGYVVVLYLGAFHFSHLYIVLNFHRLLTCAVGTSFCRLWQKEAKTRFCSIRSASAEITAVPLLFIFLRVLFLLTVVVAFTFYFIGNLSVAVFIITTARQRTAQFQTTFNKRVRYVRADPIAH